MSTIKDYDPGEVIWLLSINQFDRAHLVGAFTTRADAVAYCRANDYDILSNDTWLIVPCRLNPNE